MKYRSITCIQNLPSQKCGVQPTSESRKWSVHEEKSSFTVQLVEAKVKDSHKKNNTKCYFTALEGGREDAGVGLLCV